MPVSFADAAKSGNCLQEGDIRLSGANVSAQVERTWQHREFRDAYIFLAVRKVKNCVGGQRLREIEEWRDAFCRASTETGPAEDEGCSGRQTKTVL
jgi:hypothetical protein